MYEQQHNVVFTSLCARRSHPPSRYTFLVDVRDPVAMTAKVRPGEGQVVGLLAIEDDTSLGCVGASKDGLRELDHEVAVEWTADGLHDG